MPPDPEDAGTDSNCCSGPAPPGRSRGRRAHNYLRQQVTEPKSGPGS